jgi:SAM-dependent methyltransferase
VTPPDSPVDEYLTDVHLWWHLSRPSPELLAVAETGWFGHGCRVLDLGCGLGSELGWLNEQGLVALAVGIDQSAIALGRLRATRAGVRSARADVTALPFAANSYDVALDRGCFHYLDRAGRVRYGSEVARVLVPGGRLLLRACLRSAGKRNDIDATCVQEALPGWELEAVEAIDIPSDTRTMPALLVRARSPLPT